MMQLLASLDKLKSTGRDSKGRDSWMALCPVHQEKTPSLRIAQCSDGSILAHCFGCGANGLDLYEHFGLDKDELFGGKKLDSGHVPNQLKESYQHEKIVVMIYQADVEAKKYITLKDKHRYKLAAARVEGLKNKFPNISD